VTHASAPAMNTRSMSPETMPAPAAASSATAGSWR
jgi:hypothetical protein